MTPIRSITSKPFEPFPGKRTFGTRLENEVMRNQVLNRSVLDLLGYEIWGIGLARNKYERLERLLDTVGWFTIGITLPILIQRPLSRWYTRRLHRQFPVSNEQLMQVSLKDLERNAWASPESLQTLARKLGLKTTEMLPKLVNKLILGKLGMIFFDLAIMAGHATCYFWGRNLLTEKLSHQTGFSGEFNQATRQQLEAHSTQYQQEKARNMKRSIGLALFCVTSLPLALLALLKAPAKSSRSLMGRLKKLLPAFDYHKTIYMSKWIIFWESLCCWTLSGFLAARTKNEKREHLLKTGTMDFMLFIGDSILCGLLGKAIQRSERFRQPFRDIPLYRRGLLGIPVERKLDDIQAQISHTDLDNPAKQALHALADRVGRWNYRLSLLSTALISGIGMTLINNHYTRKKLLAEQASVANKNPSPAGLLTRKPGFAAFIQGA